MKWEEKRNYLDVFGRVKFFLSFSPGSESMTEYLEGLFVVGLQFGSANTLVGDGVDELEL